MATTTEAKFACAACGKQYAWKPEMAGKKGKCKCGAALDVPMSVDEIPRPAASAASAPARGPARAPAGEPSLHDLVALTKGEVREDAAYRCPWCGEPMEGKSPVCAKCKMNIKTGKKYDPKKEAAAAAARKKAEKAKAVKEGRSTEG